MVASSVVGMDVGAWGCGDELVAALSATSGVLEELPVTVCRLGGGDLETVLGVVDRLAAVAAAARFTLASEAEQRGEVRCSASGTVRQWVADRCPSMEAREVGVLAKAVARLNTPVLETARAAVACGGLSVPAGVVVASELADLRPLLRPGVEGSVLNGLVEVGSRFGCVGVRGLREFMLARYGHGAEIQDEQDRRSGLTTLSGGSDIGGGVTEYRMRLTPDSRAVVEAAINTLTAPRPVVGMLDGLAGTIGAQAPGDTRTVEQRRGDALATCADAPSPSASPPPPTRLPPPPVPRLRRPKPTGRPGRPGRPTRRLGGLGR